MENWKQIPEYPHYWVSDRGRVKTLAKDVPQGKYGATRHVPETILKARYTTDQYLSVNLWRDSKQKTFRVHRLVAKLFIPNPENKRCVNHKNWNRQDNRVSNLEWVTHAENSQHSIHLFKRGDDHYNAKLTAEDVMQIRIRHRFGECSLEIAKDFQMHPFNIYLIINRKTWKHVA